MYMMIQKRRTEWARFTSMLHVYVCACLHDFLPLLLNDDFMNGKGNYQDCILEYLWWRLWWFHEKNMFHEHEYVFKYVLNLMYTYAILR